MSNDTDAVLAQELLQEVDITKVHIDVKNMVDAETFFKTREGLSVEMRFRELFVSQAPAYDFDTMLSKCVLSTDASDGYLQGSLIGNYAFEAKAFCQILALLLKYQRNGNEWILATECRANIFFVWDKDKRQVFTVSVVWDSGNGMWCVRVWSQKVCEWYAGSQVFLPNC